MYYLNNAFVVFYLNEKDTKNQLDLLLDFRNFSYLHFLNMAAILYICKSGIMKLKKYLITSFRS